MHELIEDSSAVSGPWIETLVLLQMKCLVQKWDRDKKWVRFKFYVLRAHLEKLALIDQLHFCFYHFKTEIIIDIDVQPKRSVNIANFVV